LGGRCHALHPVQRVAQGGQLREEDQLITIHVIIGIRRMQRAQAPRGV
jgi:hypothetical protein